MTSPLDRLYQRIRMTLAGVTISATNDTDAVHRVQGKVRGTPETIDNIQVLQIYGLASHAPVGSDACVIFGNGDRSNGVAIATGNQRARPRNQKEGEVTIFTDEGDTISLQRGQLIVVTTKDVVIKSSNKVRMETPRLEVTGDIIDHCDSQSHTAANMRTIYNSHTHGGVQPGGGTTSTPGQPQE